MADYMDKNLQLPNYSGVNIQIINPAVNMGNVQPAEGNNNLPQKIQNSMPVSLQSTENIPFNNTEFSQIPWESIPKSSIYSNNNEINNNIQYPQSQYQGYPYSIPYPAYQTPPAPYQQYQLPQSQESDIKEKFPKINTGTKKKEIVILTDDYIKSLENYLNNPNKEVRLQAAKAIVSRFEEMPGRFDDPALNALLNKMLQDPQASVRGIALSLISTGTAQGNNYTVQLLKQIESNTINKEDALHASEALLRMSEKTETIDIPIKPAPVKEGKDVDRT